MMTYHEAKSFQQRLTDDTRKLTRTRKPELVVIRRQQLAADGVIWESGGPRTKDELVNDILNRRYPLAQVNEATHVLYHAPSSTWPACEHCQARPATENVNTSELRPGDVVLHAGMRIRVDDVRGYVSVGVPGRAFSCHGTVLNVDEVVEQRLVPESFLAAFDYVEGEGFAQVRNDAWTIQGNARTVWLVELPRPAAQR